MSAKLPRYLLRVGKGEKLFYRYLPPQDAVDAGIVVRKSFKNDGWRNAFAFARAQNELLDAWRKERKQLKALTTDARVKHLVQSYRENISFTKLVPKTQQDYIYYLERWSNTRMVGGSVLYDARLSDLTTPMCQRIYEEHAERSVSLANHALAVYRLMFNYAIRHGFTLHNPFSKVLRRVEKARKVVWTRDNVRAFLDVAYSNFKWRNIGLLVQMTHEWGQRLGDMRMLRWSSYNIETGVLSLEQSKRGASVTIPTSVGLQEMLKQQHEEYGWQEYVAPSNRPDRKGGLVPFSPINLGVIGSAIMKEAGLPPELKLMDLRRTAVTEMLEAGVPITNIMSVTGHATPQSLAPYLKHTLQGATVAAQMRGLL